MALTTGIPGACPRAPWSAPGAGRPSCLVCAAAARIILLVFLALSFWTVLLWVGIALGALIAFFVVEMIYLAMIFAWEDQNTRGLAYYGRPPAEREKFKRTLRRHGLLLSPILRLLGKTSNFTFEKASFTYEGVAGPKGTCSADSFRSAHGYQTRPEDVFVATQMKSGTTWMQHVVYQVLHRGAGDLVETGTALYAVSPWLEGVKSVSLDEAPLLGSERPSRIIKTHFPASLCPFSPEAKYIYVARHPVACFASCVDFVSTNLGAFMPSISVVEKWYCTENQMWWGTWPMHVKGWWTLAQQRPNVLFIQFEDMKRDLPTQIRRVAEFLGVESLEQSEIDAIAHKCGFAYMQEHGTAFEMHPPHILETEAELFVSGASERHKDVPDEVRERIAQWCRDELAGTGVLESLYPDVVGQPETAERPA